MKIFEYIKDLFSFRRQDGDYIKVRGYVYERLDCDTESIPLDIDCDNMNFINEMVSKGHYINKQDMIRHALRKAVENNLSFLDKEEITIPLDEDNS